MPPAGDGSSASIPLASHSCGGHRHEMKMSVSNRMRARQAEVRQRGEERVCAETVVQENLLRKSVGSKQALLSTVISPATCQETVYASVWVLKNGDTDASHQGDMQVEQRTDLSQACSVHWVCSSEGPGRGQDQVGPARGRHMSAPSSPSLYPSEQQRLHQGASVSEQEPHLLLCPRRVKTCLISR